MKVTLLHICLLGSASFLSLFFTNNLCTKRPPIGVMITRGCVMQFWPPDDEHMCSKHVEAWNKLIVKQKKFVHQVG